jgi:serine/threonine protein kinase
MQLSTILDQFGINVHEQGITPISIGLINSTWKIGDAYILQKVNTQVFSKPEYIAANNAAIYSFFNNNFPNQIVQTPVKATNNSYLVHDETGVYRMFVYIPNTHTISVVANNEVAYEAAKAFGNFTHSLANFPLQQLHIALPNFHNLQLRFVQLQQAIQTAATNLLQTATPILNGLEKYSSILAIYNASIQSTECLKRVTHQDTKISNVLFNEASKAVCVIDTDTVMPGYFFSDVGDMMRTYTCTQNEESTYFSALEIIPHRYEAVAAGYMHPMHTQLNTAERSKFFYSGAIMLYMQCMRFITDFLNGNTYYTISYAMQNHNRAFNQLCLLNSYMQQQKVLEKLW